MGKKLLGIFLALTLLFGVSTTAFAAEPDNLFPAIVQGILAAPQSFYAPSVNPDDYALHTDNTVWCNGELIGWVTISDNNVWSYVSVNKTTPYNTCSILDSIKLNVPAIKQPDSVSCWATCVSMISQYTTGKAVPVDSIVKYVFGTANPGHGGDWDDVVKGYKYCGLDFYYQNSSLSFAELWAVLKNNKPIQIGGTMELGDHANDHSMVISGAIICSDSYDIYINEPTSGSVVLVAQESSAFNTFRIQIPGYAIFDFTWTGSGWTI